MKPFRFLHSIMLAGAMLAVLAYGSYVAPLLDFVVSTARALKNWALDGFKLAASQGEGMGRPQVWIIRAKAFVLRLAKRERPVVTASWRHCPST